MVLAPAALCLALLVAASASAAGAAPLSCTLVGDGSRAALQRLADDLRAHHGLLARLVKRTGPPSACQGRAGPQPDDGASRVEFSWPDGSRLELASLPPETSTVLYSNPQGLPDAEAVVAAFRAYASEIGLHIDRVAAKTGDAVDDGAARTVEYQDPDVNGIVRLMVDQRRRLVAVSLSLAL